VLQSKSKFLWQAIKDGRNKQPKEKLGEALEIDFKGFPKQVVKVIFL